VGSLGGAFMIYLRLIDASGRAVRTESTILDPKQAGLREAARAFAFRLLVPEKYTGTINVQVDVANAWIYLDGNRIARSPAGLLTGISVGTHALRVTHEAYRDFVRFVRVGFEERAQVPVQLSAFPIKAEEMRLVESQNKKPVAEGAIPWYRQWWVVAAFGAVVLGAATTTTAILAKRTVARDSELTVRP
jgi:hypothetical protein